MSRDRQPCAMCNRFTIADYPEQAAAGNGRCTGFDKFVAHDAAPCVLFLRERNRASQAARERFVAKHQQDNALVCA